MNEPQGPHGAIALRDVAIESYSLEIEDSQGWVGDQASQTAFREVLAQWDARLRQAGAAPFGDAPVDQMSKRDLDRLAKEGSDTARVIAHAIDEFTERLAYVIQRFLRHPRWQGVERIVVGGGFKESDIGRLAIRLTSRLLAERGTPMDLRPLHHSADDAGMVGWVHAVPPLPGGADAFLAVDLGGTNVRAGIVALGEADPADLATARIVKRRIWRHADHAPTQEQLLGRMLDMLRELSEHAAQHGIRIAPVVGVSCPGIVRRDGTISRGAQNLPGDWHGRDFNLPRHLQARLPGGPIVLLHNDAAMQGLSELPFVRDVDRWAALTIGTGLGNASYVNGAQPLA